jgi:hypothetical protein
LWFVLTLLFLIVAVYVFIQTPFGQNWIARQVTNRLSHDLKTKVSIAHVSFSLFNRMHLEGVLLEDQKGDTLLYAGDLKLRITDWFFLKKQSEIKYVGLENALVKFQRTDSVWSQQFLFDYFSSPSGNPKKKSGMVLNLKTVELTNVRFVQNDKWMGQDINFLVGHMNMDANDLSLSGNRYEIKDLYLKDPVMVIKDYQRLKPYASFNNFYESNDSSSGWNMGSTVFKIANLTIENGTFKTDKAGAPVSEAAFDGNHLLFTEINGKWTNSSFIGDTVISHMQFSAKEKSGLVVKNLTSTMKMTPKGMYFNDLDLETNRSRLHRYYAMTYSDISDMAEYIDKVKMKASFEDSYINSDDLAFFAPAMKSWHRNILVRGNAEGTVAAINGKDLLIRVGNSTLLSGDLSLTGLPDIEKTYIVLHAKDLRTNYADAVTMVPALRKVNNPDLRAFKYMDFQGVFKGYISDFNADGNIHTNLGNAKANITVRTPAKGLATYTAKINTGGFQLGSLLHQKDLGAVAMNGTITGAGNDITIDAQVPYAVYKDYKYTNITINGKVSNQSFQGYASIHDPNADITIRGKANLNNDDPRFNLIADVAYLDLYNTGFSKDSLSFRGLANLDFAGASLDDFTGSARIYNAELNRNGHRLPFDSLVLRTSIVNGQKQLDLVSNEITATVNGDFKIADLGNTVTYFLHKYYPAYVSAPNRLPANQNVNFDIYLYSVDEYMQLIDPNLSGFTNSHFSGKMDLLHNEIELNAEVPQFKYHNYNFNFTKINAKGTTDSLVLDGIANDIRINDSLSIPSAIFHINAHNDSSLVSITTGAKAIEKADLHALVLTYNDGLKIEFGNSNFSINGKIWTIEPNGELVLRRNTPASGSVVLSEADQRIVIKTQPATGQKWNDIKVELTKLNMGDISPYFLPDNRLEGLLSGNILIQDPTGNLKIRSDDISTQFLRLDNDSIGEVKSSLFYDNATGELRANGNTLNQKNYLGFDAHIFLTDKEKAKHNIISLDANNFQLNVLERFLGSIFSEMRGYLTGNIKVTGPFDEVSVTGKAHLKDAGVRIKMTQCFYWIKDTDIKLDSTQIDFGGILLTDSITGNPIYVNRGRIEHQFFKNMFYDIDISTRKPGSGVADNRPVQLLNTTYADSKQFYGNVRGTGSLAMAGPQSDMYMKIDAVASTLDSSYITLPPSTGRESGIADFLVERKYGKEMTVEDLRLSTTNITYDIDLAVNKTPVPMVTVNVVLDDLTGDAIKGKGYGALNIHSGTNEPLSLRGRFNIVEGRYLFTFQSFFKKPFDLRTEHDNYIEWNGNPYNAFINFEAVYKAERVSFAPLSALASNARGDVYVVASLKDSLYKPTIQFALDFPTSSVAVTDPELALIFQQMQKNPDEVVRQATYLIVFNSFAPSGLEGGNYSVAALGLTTISGIFLNVINDQINKILGNLLKSDKYNITLNTSIYNKNVGTTTIDLGGNINFSVGRSFFNNRFKISTGVGYDAGFSQNNSIGSTNQLLPDVTMEWMINPSGSVRASFFYRENIDYLTTATTITTPGKARRIGANISYRKDFDRFGDIFRRKKKITTPSTPSEQEGIPVKTQ